MRPLLTMDLETFRIGDPDVVPRAVCAAFAWRSSDGEILTNLVGNGAGDGLEDALETVLDDREHMLVTQGGEFDYAVICRTFPRLIPKVFEKVVSGTATDTLWREKLLNLSDTGKLDKSFLPDGTTRKITYDMGALVHRYLGLDISSSKQGDDVWRLNFDQLDGWEAKDYPTEAAEYATDDAVFTLQVCEAQERRKAEQPHTSTETEHLQLAAAFALKLMGAWGMMVDGDAVDEMERRVQELLSPERMQVLIDAKILRPGLPERVQMRNGKPVCDRKKMKAAGIKDLEELPEEEREQFYKRSKAQPPGINTKELQAHLRRLYKRLGEIPSFTDGDRDKDIPDEEKKIKCDAEVHQYLADHCPIMEQYHLRESLMKITNNQIPAFRHALADDGVMHPEYNALVETSRTSCRDGGKRKGQERLFASTNIQNVPNEIQAEKQGFDPRRCYRPRPGRVFFDSDYTALELACVGQVTYNLFGHSVHLDLYNAGWDLHAFLGSQIAIRDEADGFVRDFTSELRGEGALDDREIVYRTFLKCKKAEDADARAFFKHYRSAAKPVGLGFPGGLGPATMVGYARSTFGVEMTEEVARNFKYMWLDVYPEMVDYFEWVNGQVDPHNQKGGESLYVYQTPLGMTRRGCSFCAASNGMCMQSPGAEGFKTAVVQVMQEAYCDPDSVIYGIRPIAAVHDQIIGETTEDESTWHEQVMRVREIMCESMQMVLPDVKMRSDEALLTRVWTKAAEPVYVDGRLVPWTPEAAA